VESFVEDGNFILRTEVRGIIPPGRLPSRTFKESVFLVREIVRQQWSFSPQGSTSEIEDYRVNLDSVLVLELALKPDLTPTNACATLVSRRMV
jgi:hypothetical protein